MKSSVKGKAIARKKVSAWVEARLRDEELKDLIKISTGCRMYVCRMSPLHFLIGIIFQRFELEGWVFLWVLIM